MLKKKTSLTDEIDIKTLQQKCQNKIRNFKK
jgi:hypothetical protein